MKQIKNWAHKNLKGDQVIWVIAMVFSALSVLVVYSSIGNLAHKRTGGDTEYYLFKHLVLVVLSLAAMWGIHKIDYRYYSKLSKLALWLSVPLLLFTWKYGVNINEASRWITIPLLNQAFQPSDLATLALLITLAKMLSKKQKKLDDFQKVLIPMLFMIGIVCGLIAMTNVSTSILLFATCMLMLFIGRVKVKFLLMLLIIGAVSGSVALAFGQRSGTAKSRLESFLNQDEVPYQARKSYMAIATGGLIGKGPGGSNQKNYLPHSYSDFVFAIIIEEYGLLGGLVTITLYLVLLYRGMRAVTKSGRVYGGLLSAGLSFALVMQAMVNMGVVVGIFPITGLPLPLISMGGTSQLFTGLALGIILSVSREDIDEARPQISNNYKK